MERINPFIDIYKECNNGTNEEKYEMIKNGLLEVPRYLDIELTNYCNFRCCFCPTGTKSMKRSRGFMPDEIVNKIVENVKKYNIAGIRLIRWGEPTLHPNYIEIIKQFKNINTKVHINTNGSLLDEKAIKNLVDIGLDSLKISFQGADEGTYNEMREGGDYKKLLSVVKALYEIRGDNAFPYIQITTTLTGETLEQIDNFKKDISNYCDYYNIGYTKLNHLDVSQMNIDEEEKKKIKNLQDIEKNEHRYITVCPEAFDKLSINWNGDVTLCCADYDNFMILGNIMESDLKELFLSKAANDFRDIIAAHEYNKIRPCDVCYSTVELQK